MAIGDWSLKTWSNGVDVANASNFQRFDNKIKELDTKIAIANSAIMINLNADQVVSTTTSTKILFNSQKRISGDRLTFDDANYGVKVGSDVSYVDVTANIWTDNAVGAYTALYIWKNSTKIAHIISPARLTGQDEWNSQSINVILNVTENDLIYAYVTFSSASASNKVSGNYQNTCNLMVKCIS